MKTSIIFFGAGKFGAETLLILSQSNNYSIDLVVTSPLKKQGRNRKIVDSPIDTIAKKNGIQVIRPEKIDSQFIKKIQSYKSEIGILVNSSHFLPEDLIKVFPNKIINIHPSLLPKHRGPSPIQTALLDGDRVTGITIMEITKNLDAGPIIAQYPIHIDSKDNLVSLTKKLQTISANSIHSILQKILNKELYYERQNGDLATYTKKINKNDGRINWDQSAQIINNKIRAFAGWPNSFTTFNEKKIIIHSGSVINLNPEYIKHPTGTILDGNNRTYYCNDKLTKIYASIRCQDSEFVIEFLQMANKQKVHVKDFINGNKEFVGKKLI